MEKPNSYSNWEDFRNIYLEDSFVLEIIETSILLSFKIEFVLGEQHLLYKKPNINEAYCYCLGYMKFINPTNVKWEKKNFDFTSIDANGEKDLGNIDLFYKENDFYFLEGDWGKVSLQCEQIELNFFQE